MEERSKVLIAAFKQPWYGPTVASAPFVHMIRLSSVHCSVTTMCLSNSNLAPVEVYVCCICFPKGIVPYGHVSLAWTARTDQLRPSLPKKPGCTTMTFSKLLLSATKSHGFRIQNNKQLIWYGGPVSRIQHLPEDDPPAARWSLTMPEAVLRSLGTPT